MFLLQPAEISYFSRGVTVVIGRTHQYGLVCHWPIHCNHVCSPCTLLHLGWILGEISSPKEQWCIGTAAHGEVGSPPQRCPRTMGMWPRGPCLLPFSLSHLLLMLAVPRNANFQKIPFLVRIAPNLLSASAPRPQGPSTCCPCPVTLSGTSKPPLALCCW